jgi:hypothetical protein
METLFTVSLIVIQQPQTIPQLDDALGFAGVIDGKDCQRVWLPAQSSVIVGSFARWFSADLAAFMQEYFGVGGEYLESFEFKPLAAGLAVQCQVFQIQLISLIDVTQELFLGDPISLVGKVPGWCRLRLD